MDKPKIKEPFATKDMKIPKNVVYTGDINIINAYLNGEPLGTDGQPLNERGIRHLEDRIENVKYINERAKELNGRKYIPLSAKETGNGCILEGIHQPERQQTGHCCWTMPAKLMLQSRGIDLDQESIRCYKPEISLTDEQLNDLDDNVVKEYTRNVNGNIKNLSGLMHKLVPNSAMVQISYYVPYMIKSDPEARRENELFRENFKQKVTTALSEYRSPVALLKNGHYRTIVGIDGDELIIKDSLSAIHGPDSNHRVSINSLFSTPGDSTEITFMRDLTVENAEALPAELEQFTPALQVGTGSEKGTLKVLPGVNNGIGNREGGTINPGGGLQHGQKADLLYSKPIGTRTDGSGIEVTEEWILPEKLNENVITLERTEDLNEETEFTAEQEEALNAEQNGRSIKADFLKNRELLNLAAREYEYFNELPEGGFKRMTEMVNEARQEMRQLASVNRILWTAEDMKRNGRCMRIMVLGKLIEAERAMGNNTPGALEKRFDNGNGLEGMLDDPVLNRIYEKCPVPSDMFKGDIENFITNDTAGKIVKESLYEIADKNQKLSSKERAAQKAKIANGTDPLHETERLNNLYRKLKDADPALLKSSDSFKAMKRSLETVIALRGKRSDLANESIDPARRAEESQALARAYADLNEKARSYMRTKAPSTFKSGSNAERRYAAANDVLDFSAQFGRDYVNTTEKLRENDAELQSSQRVSDASADSILNNF